jgi:hypothetical protein
MGIFGQLQKFDVPNYSILLCVSLSSLKAFSLIVSRDIYGRGRAMLITETNKLILKTRK